MFTLLAACGPSEEAAAPEIRPVRVVSVQEVTGGETVSLTGTVQAENEVNLAFRIGGRLIERTVSVGDRVEAGQVVARLDPEDDENALRAARAELAAAQGQLVEAENNYERQSTLLQDGWTTRVRYDEARQSLETIQARVDAAQAQLNIANNRLSWAELHADTAGTITARGAEAGEVVQAGQMVYRVAREDGRDAVFDVPAQVMDRAPADPEIEVSLTLNRNVRAVGRRARGVAAGRSGHRNLRGQGRADPSSGRDAAGFDRHWPNRARCRARHRDSGLGADASGRAARGMGRG